MSIWRKNFTTQEINSQIGLNMVAHLGISISEIGDDFLKGTMPVNEKTRQPMGLLHGGASVTLAESLGSMASFLIIDEGKSCVGLEINANHLRPKFDGVVTGTCKPLHLGRTTHIWDIQITDEHNKLICISRLTMAILKPENH